MPRWIVNIVIIGFLIAMVFSLGVALFPLLRGGDSGRRVVAALTWRVGLACTLFLLLLLGLATGIIEPHGLAMQIHDPAHHSIQQMHPPHPSTDGH
jgi:hypothetical protein